VRTISCVPGISIGAACCGRQQLQARARERLAVDSVRKTQPLLLDLGAVLIGQDRTHPTGCAAADAASSMATRFGKVIAKTVPSSRDDRTVMAP
jgi:hypothetical protein